MKKPYKRILLKLSGETLLSDTQTSGIDFTSAKKLATTLQKLQENNLQIGIVVGAGNIFRGLTNSQYGWKRTTADSIGMLATIINCLTLRDALEQIHCPAHVLSMIPCGRITDDFTVQRALALLESNTITIFSGGTGNPFFTTDTAAALKACEIQADVLIKATKVDGVYTTDPKKNSNAKKYHSLTFTEMLEKNLQVIDAAAIAICRDNNLPIRILDFFSGNFIKDLYDPNAGTLISSK
jgi:uridylate kinase